MVKLTKVADQPMVDNKDSTFYQEFYFCFKITF